MPVEFALRPRIRLREDLAPRRRARMRLPRFVLPVAAYWLIAGGAVYGFVHWHAPGAALPPADEQASAAAPPAGLDRAWWQRTPAAPPLAPAAPPLAPEPEPKTEPEAPPASAPTPEPEPAPQSETAPALDPVPEAAPERAPKPLAEVAMRPSTPFQAQFRASLAHDAPRARAEAPAAPDPALARSVPAPDTAHVSGLPSCEAALATSNQDVDFSQGNRTADLPTQAIAAVLENGAWLSSCNVPASTSVEVCVAIRGGNVIGASVSARPADAALSSCIRRRAAALQFPYSPHIDLARTRF